MSEKAAAPTTPTDEISSEQACRMLSCTRPTLHRHVREGSLSVRREEHGKRLRTWYRESEVLELAERWRPRRRRNAHKVALNAVMTNERGRLAARIIPLLGKKSLKEICIECDADPVVVQDIYEALEQGIDGRIKLRQKQERDERTLREERERIRDERTEKHRRHELAKLRLEGRKRAG